MSDLTASTSTSAPSSVVPDTGSRSGDLTDNSVLLDIPHASTLVAETAPEVTHDELVQQQATTVQSAVSELSSDKPSVQFQLDQPLDNDLFETLVSKGYNVSTSSRYSSVNGKSTRCHSVTVALPNSSTQQFLDWRPRWALRPSSWWTHW